jgi:asparagine synthase (glutamine-hydrolysing)
VNRNLSEQEGVKIAQKMGDAIAHRGPDAHGVWSGGNGVFLSHRRLSILDLSPAGHQPMTSHDQRYVIVYNGEIYNFNELRTELNGVQLRGHSDTEIFLELVSKFGPEKAFRKIKGMFAFAIFDREKNKLIFARDRIGEKPLYYGFNNGNFLFASELKAFFAVPRFSPQINEDALGLFFKFNYVPAPHSIYKGIYKLPQAHWAELDLNSGAVSLHRYWQYPEPLSIGDEGKVAQSFEEATDEFHEALKKTIRNQMHSDVPLGSFLSGGLDSSLVTAVMQSQSSQPVRTFTIGFREKDYDESGFAKVIADHLGCKHTEWVVTPEDAKDLIPGITRIYDEPFSDSSQLPTVLLSKMTSKEVKVVLSGDGGDELLGGYNRYLWLEKIWNKAGPIPLPIRKAISGFVGGMTEEGWQSFYQMTSKVLPGPKFDNFGQKLYKLAGILSAGTEMEAYDRLLSHWQDSREIVSRDIKAAIPTSLEKRSTAANMMWFDSQNYLPDDIMVKVDRATMSVSLESRAPFLDHELIELVSKWPLSYKIKNNQSKLMIRSVLSKYVPLEMFERSKKGFAVPISSWLRGDLKQWADDLLSSPSLSHGLLNTKEIQKKWKEHRGGECNWSLHLWDVLVFQMWYFHAFKVS